MARPQLILPRADAACGRTFFADRRTADGHRIALEVWNRATGHDREGHRLAVFRCKRCGGFHVAQMSVERLASRQMPLPDPGIEVQSDHETVTEIDREESPPVGNWGDIVPRVHRAALAEPAWA